MYSIARLLGQAVIYGVVGAMLGYLSNSPAYTYAESGTAEIMLSFIHGGDRVAPCRKLTGTEIAEIAPNMRRKSAEVCPRERVPVFIEFDLDGERLLEAALPPGGLAGDTPSQINRRFVVPAGSHTLSGRLRDSTRSTGFDYSFETDIELAPHHRFVIDFRDELGGFLIGANGPEERGEE